MLTVFNHNVSSHKSDPFTCRHAQIRKITKEKEIPLWVMSKLQSVKYHNVKCTCKILRTAELGGPN